MSEVKVQTKENWLVRNKYALAWTGVVVVVLAFVIWVIVEYVVPDAAAPSGGDAGPTDSTDSALSEGTSYWLTGEIPVFDHHPDSATPAGQFTYHNTSGDEGLDLVYFDEDWKPLAVSPLPGIAAGEHTISYRAPAGSKYVATNWEGGPGAVTVMAARNRGLMMTRFGTMGWNGVYMMIPRKPIPAGSVITFALRGVSGTEAVRCGALTAPMGNLVGFATPNTGAAYIINDTTDPPRVLVATRDDGGSLLQLSLVGQSAGALLIEFSNDAANRDVYLTGIDVDGTSVWEPSNSADTIRLPGYVWDGTVAGLNPVHFAYALSDVTTDVVMRRTGHRELVVVGVL